MTKSVLKKVSWTLISNLIYAATQFLTISMISKIGGPIEVGIFTLALAISSPFFLFFNVKLRSVILTDQNNENTFWEYRRLRNYTNILAFLMILITSFIIGLEPYILISVMALAVAKVFEMSTDLNYGFYQKNNRFDLVGKSTILRGTLNFFLAFSTYYIFNSIVIMMMSFIISNSVIYFLFDSKKIKPLSNTEVKHSPSFRSTFKLFLLAMPLGLSTVIGSLNTNVPRYVIENKLGLYELGIFSGLTYLLVIGNTFLSAISPVITPRLAKLGQERNLSSFIRLLLKLIAFGFSLSLILIVIFWFFGKKIITLIYTEAYADYHNVLMVVVIGLIFLYSSVFLGTAITALRKFKVQPVINGLGLVSIIISSLLLVDRFGLIGMSYSLLLNYIIVSIGYCIALILILRKMKGEMLRSESVQVLD